MKGYLLDRPKPYGFKGENIFQVIAIEREIEFKENKTFPDSIVDVFIDKNRTKPFIKNYVITELKIDGYKYFEF